MSTDFFRRHRMIVYAESQKKKISVLLKLISTLNFKIITLQEELIFQVTLLNRIKTSCLLAPT